MCESVGGCGWMGCEWGRESLHPYTVGKDKEMVSAT